MRDRYLFGALIAVPVVLAGWLLPAGGAEPVRVEPRRNSHYPSAYVVYGFTQKGVPRKDGTRGPEHLYYLVIESDHRRALLLPYDELRDHYRVNPEQLNRVPSRLPGRWISNYMAQKSW